MAIRVRIRRDWVLVDGHASDYAGIPDKAATTICAAVSSLTQAAGNYEGARRGDAMGVLSTPHGVTRARLPEGGARDFIVWALKWQARAVAGDFPGCVEVEETDAAATLDELFDWLPPAVRRALGAGLMGLP